MFFSAWFIVTVVLFITLFVLFMAFIKWLAHSLEGYPMSLIQNADRGTGAAPLSMRIRSGSENSPVSSGLTDSSGVRARNQYDETIGQHARRL
jgi:hypothetical protein